MAISKEIWKMDCVLDIVRRTKKQLQHINVEVVLAPELVTCETVSGIVLGVSSK